MLHKIRLAAAGLALVTCAGVALTVPQTAMEMPVVPLQERLAAVARELDVPGCVLVERKATAIARYDVRTDCILVSPQASAFGDPELRFILAHEQAHRVLGHAEEMHNAQVALVALYKRPLSELSEVDELLAPARRSLEFAADAEAQRVLVARGEYSQEAVARLLLNQTEETATHPAGPARLAELAHSLR